MRIPQEVLHQLWPRIAGKKHCATYAQSLQQLFEHGGERRIIQQIAKLSVDSSKSPSPFLLCSQFHRTHECRVVEYFATLLPRPASAPARQPHVGGWQSSAADLSVSKATFSCVVKKVGKI